MLTKRYRLIVAVRIVGALAVLALWVTGCSTTPSPTAAPTGSQGQAPSGYPPPTPQAVATAAGYPAPTEPAPTPVGAVPFVLTRPILEGTTTVSGHGLPGVPLLLQDVTFMGAEIAATTVAADGSFTFSVPALERNHRIGIAVGDLTGTPWTLEVLFHQAFWGPGAQQLPQVGFYLDTELVREPPSN